MRLNSKEQAEAFKILNSFTNYERALRYPYDGWAMNLERVSALLSFIDHPEKALNIIHIAGTKGKGSTSYLVASFLKEAGYNVGLFTSPHLLEVNERIQLNFNPISNEELANLIFELKPALSNLKKHKKRLGDLTYFELLTVIALLFFQRKKADWVVLETGLGGRYDATNVCEPKISVITPISFDHTDILGKSLTQIAREKAMIIKPDTPVVVSPQSRPVLREIQKRAKELNSELYYVARYCNVNLKKITPQGMEFNLEGAMLNGEFSTPLVGTHQLTNIKTSAVVFELLKNMRVDIKNKAFKDGLKKIKIPGRFQIIKGKPELILDGAHNRASAFYLADTLKKVFPKEKFWFLMSLGKDKDARGFISEISRISEVIIFTKAKRQKAFEPKELCSIAKKFPLKFEKFGCVDEAMSYIFGRMLSRVVITGSFYLLGEVIEWLKRQGKTTQ